MEFNEYVYRSEAKARIDKLQKETFLNAQIRNKENFYSIKNKSVLKTILMSLLK
ncbi:hypothetical protein ACFQ3N_04895 [Virgibacillus byunsanensis]|uniref:Uncharacterized protein n=1 Tax=Virgibacillus byunsanensis TaxID=570945 RepID=A0ABW3LJB4_9BACI